jgi:hypothetical protein
MLSVWPLINLDIVLESNAELESSALKRSAS